MIRGPVDLEADAILERHGDLRVAVAHVHPVRFDLHAPGEEVRALLEPSRRTVPDSPIFLPQGSHVRPRRAERQFPAPEGDVLSVFAQLAGAQYRQPIWRQRHAAGAVNAVAAIRAIRRGRYHPGDHTRSR